MFTKAERLISLRNLRPKKKEGFLKIISIFSFLGIMLGVSILIIVMSIMNGFKTDLTKKILGLNPHVIIQPNGFELNDSYIKKLKLNFKNISLSRSFSGEGIIISNNSAKGVILKGINKSEKKIIEFFENFKIKGNLKNLDKNNVFIGNELAFNLNLKEGDNLSIMSSAFVATPLGSLPKQENFKVAGIFSTGFLEFDQNVIYLNIQDALSIFDKQNKDQNIEIYLDDPLKANLYKNKIEKINQNYFIYTWSDLNRSLFSALKVERNVMFIILSLIVVVAAFNIISGLTILIKNKTKEIAILKTLGLSNKSIKKSFFLTGFTIGFASTITGIILGILVSINIEKLRLILSSVFNLEIFPSDIYFLDKLPSEVNFNSIFIIFIISLLISAVASYLPAMRISKMKTFRALRYEVTNLKKSFKNTNGSITLFDNFNIKIKEGELVALVGPSGSGKSSLLHILALLDEPSKGKISINRKEIKDLSDIQKDKLRQETISIIFQDNNLLTDFTAKENIMMPLVIKDENENIILEKVNKILKDVKISDRSNHFPNELSGGEQQRVAIARALIAETNLILADEPTGNLDFKTSKEIFSLFLKLKKLKKTIIFATHNRELANRADYKLFISDGIIKRVNARQ